MWYPQKPKGFLSTPKRRSAARDWNGGMFFSSAVPWQTKGCGVGGVSFFFWGFPSWQHLQHHAFWRFRLRDIWKTRTKNHMRCTWYILVLELSSTYLLSNCFTRWILLVYSKHCNPCGSWNPVNPSQSCMSTSSHRDILHKWGQKREEPEDIDTSGHLPSGKLT